MKSTSPSGKFELRILAHRVRIFIRKTPPYWVPKGYRQHDGLFMVSRQHGEQIWVRASEDRILVEDTFLHECSHMIWHALKEYNQENRWSESVADHIAAAYWEIEKGLKEIRRIYAEV